MVLSELRTMLTELLSFDLDNVKGESPTDVELDGQINEAQSFASRETFLFDPKVPWTIKKDVSRYNLHDLTVMEKRIVRPYWATINGNKLYNARRDDYGIWTYGEFIDDHQTWEDDSSGTPTKVVLYNAANVILHLAPTATVVSTGKNYLAGHVLANDMTADDHSPEGFPEDMHEAIAFRAAWKAAIPQVTEAEGWRRLAEYERQWKEPLKELRNQNKRLFNKGSRSGEYNATYIEA